MHQIDLLHDSIYDAIGADVQALGGPKSVASRLWPGKALDSAYAHLKACLRDDKPEKFSPEEVQAVITWARDEGSHATINYLCDACGYTRPEVCSLDEQKAALQRQMIDATKTLERAIKRMEALQE